MSNLTRNWGIRTVTFKDIASDTFFLRALFNIEVNKTERICTYTKLGIRKTITGEKYDRLKHLINLNKGTNNRMAMVVTLWEANTSHVIIDRAFYDEF